MSCECRRTDKNSNLPMLAPQPPGPAEKWPVFFVPSSDLPGVGLYYCPVCEVGLAEARHRAGMPVINDNLPRSLWVTVLPTFTALAKNLSTTTVKVVERICPRSTVGESR